MKTLYYLYHATIIQRLKLRCQINRYSLSISIKSEKVQDFFDAKTDRVG